MFVGHVLGIHLLTRKSSGAWGQFKYAVYPKFGKTIGNLTENIRKMNTLKTKILASAVVAGLLTLAIVFAIVSKEPQTVQGSVAQSGEYNSTSTRSFTGTNNIANFSILTATSSTAVCWDRCPGVVGSVVIGGASASVIRLWDATTTDVTKRAGATSTLEFIEVVASQAAGTYTYDVNFDNGILYELVSGTSAATSSITFRNR